MMATAVTATGTICLIRHGHTAANADRYVGWEDEPLDSLGQEQARNISLLLADRKIDKILTSPLSRARDTAAPLAEAKRLTVEVRLALVELNFGSMQGFSKTASALRVRTDHLWIPIAGGESLADVSARLATVAEELKVDLHAGLNVAVFSHFWTCRMLLGLLLGLPLNGMFDPLNYKPGNGSVLEVDCVTDALGNLQIGGRRMLEVAAPKIGAAT